MAHIRSRKHAPAAPRLTVPALAALASLALPTGTWAQSTPTAPSTQVEKPAASTDTPSQTLAPVRIKGKAENSYKPPEKAATAKQTQPLIETPQTITVVKKELLQDQGSTTLTEALRNTPGITFTLGENGNTTTGDSVFMRGFDTSNSIFLDGIRDLGGITRDTFNTESVEIVKGPAGTDNGRGSPTGYINLNSKTAQASELTSMTLTGATNSRLRATADINRPLDLDIPGAALRLNVMVDQGDKLGRDVAKNRSWGIAPSLALGLGTPTRTFLNYLHVEQDNIPDGGIPAIGKDYVYSSTTASSAIINAINAAPSVDTANFYGSKDDHDKIEADVITLRLEHDLAPGTTVRNTLRYGQTKQQAVLTGINALTVTTATLNDPSKWTVTRSRQGKDILNEVLVNQTNLNTGFSLAGMKHTVSTGLEFMYERQKALGFTTSGTTTAASLYNPSTADTFASVVPSGAQTDGHTVTAAAYLFDNIELAPKWELNAGLRLEKFRTEYTSLPATTATSQAATKLSTADTLINGKLGLVFKPTENSSVYAAYATSQQPPGGANFTLSATAANIANPNMDPQKAQTLEIGTKWALLDNRLVLSAAAYDTTNENDLATTDTVTGEVIQYGKKKVQGLEFAAAGAITADWQINAGLALMDTQVEEGSATQTGSMLQYSPKTTFTLWNTYKLPFGLTLGGGARYVASQATQINNSTVTGMTGIPSYWVFDAMASYPISKNITLQANVTNLMDKEYIASVNSGRSRYTLGAPRAAQITAKFDF